MSRYRKIDPRMWGDKKFRSLSKPQPNGQSLWIYLLTGPHTNSCPGLFHSGKAGMAEKITWPLQGFIRAWKEIEDAKMAFADWESKLVWVPRAIKYNPPESPNVAASWREWFEELPECDLKNQAKADIEAYLIELGDTFFMSWEAGSKALARTIYRIPRKIPIEIAQAVRKRDGNKCRHCGKEVNWNDRRGPDGATYDHLNPMLGHTEENIVVSCRSCNSKRSNLGKYLSPNLGNNSDQDLGRDSGYASNQEQEQEQEQEQDLKPLRDSKKPRPPEKKTNPHIKEFIDFYFQEFKGRFQIEPIIEGGKDGTLIKGLLEKIDFNELKILLVTFLDSDDPFIQKSGYTIGAFKSQVQKLRIGPKKSPGKTFEAGDLWEKTKEREDAGKRQKEIQAPNAKGKSFPALKN